MEDLKPGDPATVGPYRLLGRLGAGGMGQVFLGITAGGRKVAVKLIRADHIGLAQFELRIRRRVPERLVERPLTLGVGLGA